MAALFVGCGGPGAVASAAVDASAASSAAIAMYDKSGDGLLDDAELAAAPGMAKYKAKYDLDGDGAVSRDEIAARIDLWDEQAMGVMSVNVIARLDKRPLAGAEIKLVPEAYLGDGPKTATGVTDAQGYAKMSVPAEALPEPLQKARLRGVYGGVYKIEVTHPQRPIPAKYNASTVLGEEIARDTLGDRIELDLESR